MSDGAVADPTISDDGAHRDDGLQKQPGLELMQHEKPRPKLAVLIDGENISPIGMRGLLREIHSHGDPCVRRLYCSNSISASACWGDAIEMYGLEPRHQAVSLSKKNTIDVRLAVEAMDLLYSGWVNVFALVSNDADFAPLATRIRESGLDVIGFGNDGSAATFRHACTRFIYLENIHPEAKVNNPKSSRKPLRPPSDAAQILLAALASTGTYGGWARIDELAGTLSRQHSDWDTRTYGFRSLRELLVVLPRFQIHHPDGGVVRVRYIEKRRRARAQARRTDEAGR